MAERLTFLNNAIPYASMLASEHLSRYLMVRGLCQNLRVLDIACGEGYGSSLMRSWGAREVVGVDISPEAVENARTLFGHQNGLSFVQADATRCAELVSSLGQFDLIVCFETIEHVEDVAQMLTGFSQLRAAQGRIVISCPNDPAVIPGQPNEFHLQTYSFEDFQAAVTPVLGPADSWLLGTSLIGFGAVQAQSTLLSPPPQGLIGLLDMAQADHAQFIPSQVGHEVSTANAAFYVGAWGCSLTNASVFAPISFSAYESPWNNWVATKKEVEFLSEQLAKASRENAVLKIKLTQAQDSVAGVREDYEAALAQREAAIANVQKLNDEALDQLRRLSDELQSAPRGTLGIMYRGIRSLLNGSRRGVNR